MSDGASIVADLIGGCCLTVDVEWQNAERWKFRLLMDYCTQLENGVFVAYVSSEHHVGRGPRG
jgi:hypothetical protein